MSSHRPIENLQVKLTPVTEWVPPWFPGETTCQNVQFKDSFIPFDCDSEDICRWKPPLVPYSLQRKHTEEPCYCNDFGKALITTQMVISSRKLSLQRNYAPVVSVMRTSHQRPRLKGKAAGVSSVGRASPGASLFSIKPSTWMRNLTSVTDAGRASPGAQVCSSITQSTQGRNLTSVTGVGRALVRAPSYTYTRESTLERSPMSVRTVA